MSCCRTVTVCMLSQQADGLVLAGEGNTRQLGGFAVPLLCLTAEELAVGVAAEHAARP